MRLQQQKRSAMYMWWVARNGHPPATAEQRAEFARVANAWDHVLEGTAVVRWTVQAAGGISASMDQLPGVEAAGSSAQDVVGKLVALAQERYGLELDPEALLTVLREGLAKRRMLPAGGAPN